MRCRGLHAGILALLFPSGQSSDWAFGIFVRDPKMLLNVMHERSATKGVAAFAASFAARTPSSSRLAMLVDDDTGGALQPWCVWDGSKRCLLIRPVEALSALEDAGWVGGRGFLASSRSSLFVRRWWLYSGMMAIACRHDKRAKQGYAFLTDVRDVVWQDDLFGRLRKRARAAGLRSNEEPLFFAVEPFNGSVREEPGFNGRAAAACLPIAVQARFADLPIACAGTTGGSWAALEAYVLAMRPHVLFCAGLGTKWPFAGIDQPMHMYLLFDLLMGRRGEVGWDRRYGALLGASSGRNVTAPLHPDRDGQPAYLLLRTAALRLLGGDVGTARVVPLPLWHAEGEVCTLSLIPHANFPPPRDTGFSDITALGVQGGPLCALVHQYDRHWRLVKLVDVLYNGVDKDHLYVEISTGERF
jgi:hypothetical protein